MVSAAVQVLPSAILADAARAETKGPALSGGASYLHLFVTRLKDRLHRQREFQRELPRCVQNLLDHDSAGTTSLFHTFQKFDQPEFNTVRYVWTDFRGFLPKTKIDLVDLYRLHECISEVVHFIDKHYDATPLGDRKSLDETDGDYSHPSWNSKPLSHITRRVLNLVGRFQPDDES